MTLWSFDSGASPLPWNNKANRRVNNDDDRTSRWWVLMGRSTNPCTSMPRCLCGPLLFTWSTSSKRATRSHENAIMDVVGKTPRDKERRRHCRWRRSSAVDLVVVPVVKTPWGCLDEEDIHIIKVCSSIIIRIWRWLCYLQGRNWGRNEQRQQQQESFGVWRCFDTRLSLSPDFCIYGYNHTSTFTSVRLYVLCLIPFVVRHPHIFMGTVSSTSRSLEVRWTWQASTRSATIAREMLLWINGIPWIQWILVKVVACTSSAPQMASILVVAFKGTWSGYTQMMVHHDDAARGPCGDRKNPLIRARLYQEKNVCQGCCHAFPVVR